jgi:hypothetical protein
MLVAKIVVFLFCPNASQSYPDSSKKFLIGAVELNISFVPQTIEDFGRVCYTLIFCI